MSLSALRITKLQKSYVSGKTLLDIEALEFRSGQLTCILGATGSGKTTLLNILAGIDLEFKGEVSAINLDALRVSYQPQRDTLLPWKTIYQNLLLGYLLSKKEVPWKTAEQLLENLGLHPFAASYPPILSVGMRQRAALGRALLWDGNLKLLDEPLSAQDFSSRLFLERLLREGLRKNGEIGIVVTHNLEEAVVLADRIVVLGGTPSKVIDDFEVTGIPEENRPVAGRRAQVFGEYISRAAAALSSTIKTP